MDKFIELTNPESLSKYFLNIDAIQILIKGRNIIYGYDETFEALEDYDFIKKYIKNEGFIEIRDRWGGNILININIITRILDGDEFRKIYSNGGIFEVKNSYEDIKQMVKLAIV